LKPLDRIDEKLLAIMQSNNQLTCNEMAERVSSMLCGVTGPSSHTSMAQYESLADRYFTADPAVKRVDSLVVMKAVKGRHELSIPRSDYP
jgi:DNA-binding Lrp family transcriptional regulator